VEHVLEYQLHQLCLYSSVLSENCDLSYNKFYANLHSSSQTSDFIAEDNVHGYCKARTWNRAWSIEPFHLSMSLSDLYRDGYTQEICQSRELRKESTQRHHLHNLLNAGRHAGTSFTETDGPFKVVW